MIHDTLKPILSEIERLEKGISELETRQKELEKTLADPTIFSDGNQSVPLLNEYKTGREALDELLLRWEKRQEELDAAKSELKMGT